MRLNPRTILRPAVTAAVAALAACGKAPRPERPRVPVTVAAVRQRAVPYEISAIGSVTPIRTVAVRSQVGGILGRVGFQEGDEVAEGQVLFEIDRRPYQAALNQALGTLAKDQAQLVNARLQVTRYQELARTQMATQEQFDQITANAQALAATVGADSAAVETARLNLEYCTIRAQIAGRTGNLLLREGNLVRASDVSPLVIINEIRPIAVSFAVPQQYLDDIRRFSAGRRLDVAIRPSEDSTQSMAGTLTFINNQVDTTTGTIQLKATFANADRRLWPGEFVTVRLVLSVQPHVLTIPSQAVMTGQAGSFVYVVNADRSASTQSIQVGRAVDDDIVVESGLQAGQQVVTDGQLRLVPGARVDIKGEPGAAVASGGRQGGAPGGDSLATRGASPRARGDSAAAASDSRSTRRAGSRP
ncbi:MAG: efflux RND transporter periplasmic adaptor subunit [Gemmatimonadales bacterium]|jgi:multidrug efflux system membrane fusion protein